MQPVALSTSRFRFGLRLQLITALGALGALLAAVILIALLDTIAVQTSTRQTIENQVRLNRLANDVVISALLCRRFEKDVFLTIHDSTTRDFYFLQWQGAYENLDSAIEAFANAAQTNEEHQQADQWRLQRTNYRGAMMGIKQLILEGTITTPEAANTALSPFKEDIRALITTALTIAQQKSVASQQAESALLASTTNSRWLIMLIGAAALATALIWSFLFPARLMRPIDALRTMVDRLAAGDLSARVRLARNDELGALAHGFDQMAATIQQRNHDLETQRAQAEAARAEAERARGEVSAQLATIEEQRAVIREMSVPIMPLDRTTLVMPLVGALDSQRIRLAQEQALQAITKSSARHLLLDISAVPIVDTQVAQGILRIVQAARLLGAEVVLVGIRPEVAQAVVGLGLQLDTMVTRSSLQSGISYVQRRN